MVATKNDQGYGIRTTPPKEINSKHVERSPFIHFDGKTLYLFVDLLLLVEMISSCLQN